VLPEIGKSWEKSSFNDYVFYTREMLIGTRVKISKQQIDIYKLKKSVY
jgi:hypothetical protein